MVNVAVQWSLTYVDIDNGSIETPFRRFSALEINEILNGDILASFDVPNTDSMRDFLETNHPMQLYINVNNSSRSTLVFSGVLKAGDISANKIKFYLYDPVIVALDEAEPITGVYDAIPANEIMADVLSGLDITLGDCPTTEITVVFYKANRLDIVKFLADALGLDFYPTNGTTINIGYRNASNRTLQPIDMVISKRSFDRTKFAAKVIIRGIDTFGHHITGEAGSGTPVRTFNYDTPANQDALENIAAKKLSEMQTDSAGAPISTRIDVGYQFEVGDTLDVWSNRYRISGPRRIMQITKTSKKVSMQLDYIRKTIDKTIADLRGWEVKGIYLPGCTSWSINLQGLIGFYHLNEGTGFVAKDSSPVDNPADGTIVNCSWESYASLKILTFSGGSSYIDIGSTITFSDTNRFSIGGWFSPSELNSTQRQIIHKSGQFVLSYTNSTMRLSLTAADTTVTYFDSDAGKIKVGGRHFIMVTYDGSTVRMYLNSQLHKSWSYSATLATSVNKVYLGYDLQGVLGEMMLWNRCLVDQEVTELYFFPLNRVVQTATGGS